MNHDILKEIASRNEYIIHLEADIAKNDKYIENVNSQRGDLEQLVDNIKTLGIYPEHEALIPLSKNIYMKGKIVHTGEYYVESKAHPDSYYTLNTLRDTVKCLENRVKALDDDIAKAEYAKYQLEERMTVLKGKFIDEDVVADNDESISSDNSLPKEIHSDKGVAVKVGDFYEILEFEPGT